MFDAVSPVLRLAGFCDYFKITNTLTNSHFELMSIDDAGKMFARTLAARRFFQKIPVLGE